MTRTRVKLIAGIIVTLLIAVAAVFQFGRGLELATYEAGMWLVPQHPPNADVAVVGIDTAAIQKHGPWPWPRNILAELTSQLTAEKARVIAFVPEFDNPQNATALDYLEKIADLHAISKNREATALVSQAQVALATDSAFSDSIQNAGNVVLAARGRPTDGSNAADLPPWLVFKMILPHPDQITIAGIFFNPIDVQVRAPLAHLGQAAAGIGYLPDASPTGAQSLIVSDGEQLLPSFALLVAALDLGLKNSDIIPHATGGISLGDTYLFTDQYMQAIPRGYASGRNRNAIPVYAIDDVLEGKVLAENLTGKAVIVGLTADSANPQALVAAGMVSSILNDDLMATPFWAWWLRGLLVLLFGAYLVFAAPRLHLWLGLGASVLLLVVLVNSEFIPLISRGLWLPLTLPALFLIAGHAAVLTARYLSNRHGIPQEDFSETNRQLALAYQALGRFDEALVHYSKCTPSSTLHKNLLQLGHDHERHRRYAAAMEVYTEMNRLVPQFGNVDDRLKKLQALDSHTTVTRSHGPQISLPDNGLQKPVLGRYELIKELGRGAMSVVYLGRDQKINRTVAIKTLSFKDEFGGGVPEDVSQRFFREAETAGRLNHPNIVTIYDVGEDQGLAYIAMDYLAGESLEHYTTPGNLLPIGETMAVVIKVAEALEYAHSRQVVHRDIKPANIMYERKTGQLKITDFGVASLLNAARTRAGTILGSPSYMSPEQVAGNKADGRSDLYSLGVTLYQLLRGELPFEAPSLTGLMFKVSNTPTPDVTFLRPDIPPRLKDVVERAMQKNPDARFQTGMELATALRMCRGNFKRTG
ncbi:MAG: protein kinase [Gammaproteobacteria bacterium]|nr:protein kinase [Gammaproteobacteria bacterium]